MSLPLHSHRAQSRLKPGEPIQIDCTDFTEVAPAFLTIVLMSFTFNLGIGMTGGFAVYPVLKTISGRAKGVHAGLWILAGISLLFFFIGGSLDLRPPAGKPRPAM